MRETVSQIVLPLLTAALGYFAKDLVERWKARKKEREDYGRELRELRGLLEESQSLFQSQNLQARNLVKRLRARLGDKLAKSSGLDATLHAAFDELDGDEREIHAIIRSATVNSLKRVNERLLAWIKKNSLARHDSSSAARIQLGQQLKKLELHLNQWLDKYEATMPKDDKRCLVYLGDEKAHGTEFPRGIENDLDAVIREAG